MGNLVNHLMLKTTASYFLTPLLAIGCIISFDLRYDLVGLTFTLLFAQSVIFLHFTFSRKAGLLTVYFIFALTFFSLIPWLHYSTNHFIWRTSPITESIHLLVNLLIFLANITTILTYLYCARRTKKRPPLTALIKNKKLSAMALLALSSLSFILLLYLNSFSITQILFRGIIEENREIVVESSSLSLLLGMIARLTPVFCFLYAATQIKSSSATKTLLFTLMLLSVFPTGVARYMVAFAYIPLALLFIPTARNAVVFSTSLIFSLIFIFPFLEQFRKFSGISDLTLIPNSDFFYAAHFDAYENFATAVEHDFITFGRQFLGTIFFFIPRTIWPNKPVGSGYEMAESLGYSFNNISMPFLGEGYINFGTAGVFIFAALIGYLMARIDSRFSKNKNEIAPADYSLAVYFFLIGALFFLLRGDLLSSFAYISAGLIVATLIEKTMKLINSYNAPLKL